MPAFLRPMLLVAMLIGLFASTQQASAQAAPSLSQLYAYAVISTGYPQWDYVQGRLATTTDRHAGPELYVTTYERGYGHARRATFNGATLREVSSSADVSGGRVIGWYRRWYYRGPFTSGTFTYESTSMNSPWNKMTTRLNIR
jgi:hypothetical protein